MCAAAARDAGEGLSRLLGPAHRSRLAEKVRGARGMDERAVEYLGRALAQ